jgi:hypothetical protein
MVLRDRLFDPEELVLATPSRTADRAAP